MSLLLFFVALGACADVAQSTSVPMVVGQLGPLVGRLGTHVQCQRAHSRPAAQLGSSCAVAAVATTELVASGHAPHPPRLVLGAKLDVKNACAIHFDPTRLC